MNAAAPKQGTPTTDKYPKIFCPAVPGIFPDAGKHSQIVNSYQQKKNDEKKQKKC
jgi:hypothetical protein